MSSDYADLLKKGWDEIPEVKPLPVGSYMLQGQNAVFQPAKSADNSPSILFVYKPLEAMDDVDKDELDELGDNYDVTENRVFVRFWLETGADFDKVRKHLVKHDVDVSSGTPEDSLKLFKGTEVVAYLNQRSYTDNAGEPQIDNNAASFAAVE